MKRTILAMAVAVVLSGCATVINSNSQAVKITSAPEGAAVAISNSAGEKVHTGTTPFTVTLLRGAGYFKPESYTLTFTKEGFPTREVTITGSLSGWYIGNLLVGGLIGMLAVDPVTGAMYALPETVNGTLADTVPTADVPSQPKTEAVKTSATPSASPTLTIVSTESLSPQQLAAARPLEAAR